MDPNPQASPGTKTALTEGQIKYTRTQIERDGQEKRRTNLSVACSLCNSGVGVVVGVEHGVVEDKLGLSP